MADLEFTARGEHDGALMKERSTLQPFAPGDVFVGSTVLDGADDDHAGRGRILQFDAQLRKKGVLWLTDTTHLVGGLEFDPEGRLWAFDSQGFVVLTIARSGAVTRRDFGRRPFSNVNFASDGSLYLAEHVAGSNIKAEIQARMGTTLAKMPGSERFGDGHVWHFAADGTLLRELATEIHGGIGGFMGVTMSALSPDESTLVYCSETGPRLMRYDLENARQLPDLQCLPEGERERGMFFAMDYCPRGRLFVSRGNRIDLINESGRTTCSYLLEEHGWATLKAAMDGRHLYIGNFFSGQLAKLSLETGELIASADTGVERSLAGIAEYPGSPEAQAARLAAVSSPRRARKRPARRKKVPRKKAQKMRVRRNAAARKLRSPMRARRKAARRMRAKGNRARRQPSARSRARRMAVRRKRAGGKQTRRKTITRSRRRSLHKRSRRKSSPRAKRRSRR
jgi:sugar lactone lactonase YvrE